MDPACALTRLALDPGDGGWQATLSLPAGSYEVKATVNESWDENYRAGGAPGGAQIQFTVPEDWRPVHFQFNGATNWLVVAVPIPEPSGSPGTLAGLAALALCCARLDSRVNCSQEPPA